LPALRKTEFSGLIVWLGINTDRKKTLRSVGIAEGFASFAGFEHESRSGLTRPACSRVVTQYRKDTIIRNTRQFAMISAEELAIIAAKMGVESLDPAWLGTSIMLEGIPDFSHLPPASRLISANGTSLCIDMENRPCNLPAKVINEDLPEKGAAFKRAAKGLRGVTAWVEAEGMLRVGDLLTLHVPDQPIWQHHSEA